MDETNSTTPDGRLEILEGRLLIVEQLLGLLFAKSPTAISSLMTATKRGPEYARDMLQAYPVTDLQIEGATATLQSVIRYALESLPQRSR